MIKFQNLPPLIRIYLGIIISFLLVKFLFKPFVLSHNSYEIFEIIVLSYPNFCEAVAGSIFVVLLLLTFKGVMLKSGTKFVIKDQTIYQIAVIISGIYVILQELKIHNLGGKNTYDPYDVLFSIIGIAIVYLLILKVKPKIIIES